MSAPFKMKGHALPGPKQRPSPAKKSSPTKLAPLIAAVAPMVIKAVAGKAMEKKEK